jgi:hypothetical protein
LENKGCVTVFVALVEFNVELEFVVVVVVERLLFGIRER